ncbi:MAG: hypothetical protein NTW07_06465 [candidate division Zixibacteria bacterium]|nr:hypothetical protein [candidate division Zixibacteria bacterium]
MDWPDGKSFAFTVFDDTDNATLANVSEVYRLLADLGIRTTKSVWPSRAPEVDPSSGSTCEDPEYVGTERVSTWRRVIYDIATGFRNRGKYRGQVEGDPLFWGDLCREKIKYCRCFPFPEIDTLSLCPFMPYHDPLRPYVNYWFASAEGYDVGSYLGLISEQNQDSLEMEGGACIVYTHFASGFVRDGRLDMRFRGLMERMAQKKGWFVTTCELLDFLLERNGPHDITDYERRHLEQKWLWHKLRTGTT